MFFILIKFVFVINFSLLLKIFILIFNLIKSNFCQEQEQ